jgi:hypothetical protein
VKSLCNSFSDTHGARNLKKVLKQVISYAYDELAGKVYLPPVEPRVIVRPTCGNKLSSGKL